MTPDARAATIGVDVGGTKISVGVVEPDGSHKLVGTLPTVRGQGESNAETVRRLVASAAVMLDNPSAPVGISVTTTVNQHGRLRDASNWLGWSGWSARDILGPTSQGSATVANDALCGAVAEQRRAALSGTFLYITLGTGIAHTAVIDGRPLPGAHGGALFTAWTPAGYDSNAEPLPTWENLASGPALAHRFDGGSDARPLVTAARAGDARALAVLEEGARWFGAYLATIVQTYDPSLVVVGGGLGHGVPEYVTAATTRMRSLVGQEFFQQIPVETATLGAESGWVGAGLLAAE